MENSETVENLEEENVQIEEVENPTDTEVIEASVESPSSREHEEDILEQKEDCGIENLEEGYEIVENGCYSSHDVDENCSSESQVSTTSENHFNTAECSTENHVDSLNGSPQNNHGSVESLEEHVMRDLLTEELAQEFTEDDPLLLKQRVHDHSVNGLLEREPSDDDTFQVFSPCLNEDECKNQLTLPLDGPPDAGTSFKASQKSLHANEVVSVSRQHYESVMDENKALKEQLAKLTIHEDEEERVTSGRAKSKKQLKAEIQRLNARIESMPTQYARLERKEEQQQKRIKNIQLRFEQELKEKDNLMIRMRKESVAIEMRRAYADNACKEMRKCVVQIQGEYEQLESHVKDLNELVATKDKRIQKLAEENKQHKETIEEALSGRYIADQAVCTGLREIRDLLPKTRWYHRQRRKLDKVNEMMSNVSGNIEKYHSNANRFPQKREKPKMVLLRHSNI